MNAFDKRQKEQDERWAAVEAICERNGLVLIQLSPRRYVVARYSGLAVSADLRDDAGNRHAHFTAGLAFGPATYEDCKAWIFDNTDPIPVELHGC
jgi:hypothetical protein